LSRDPAANHAPFHNVQNSSHTITLVGAGLTGPLLAISLAQRGFPAQIFERRPDMRLTGASAGRSINLAVSTRGIHALREAGLWEQMSRIIIPMKGRMMHSLAGELTFQPYGKNDSEVINSISRADLNVALMNAAEAQGVTIHFNERCTGMDWNAGGARFRNEQTGRETTIDSEVVIGTDGSASALRVDMQKRGRLNFAQEQLDYGYKELTIAAGPGGKHVLEPHALHIWPRGAYMLIALPNIDGTFACILFLPFEGRVSFATLDTAEKAQHFFDQRFPDAVPLMRQLQENYARNPTGSMVTIKSAPWHVEGKVLLLGDAAHAIVPFFGQGMNCAFEDCTVFLELLDRLGPIGRCYSRNSSARGRSIPTPSRTWPWKTSSKCAIVSPILGFFFERKPSSRWKLNIRAISCRNMPWSLFIACRIPSRSRVGRFRIACSRNCAIPSRVSKISTGKKPTT